VQSLVPYLIGWQTKSWDAVCDIAGQVNQLLKSQSRDESSSTRPVVKRDVADGIAGQRSILAVRATDSDEGDSLRCKIGLCLLGVCTEWLVGVSAWVFYRKLTIAHADWVVLAQDTWCQGGDSSEDQTAGYHIEED